MSNPPHQPRRYAGKDAGQRRTERRDKLIDAGIRVIGTRGYRHAKVKDVCDQAGLTERYFYESFDSREDLLAAVYGHLTADLRQRTQAALEQVPAEPAAMARAGAEVYFRTIHDNPQAARILLFEAVGVSSTLQRLNRDAETLYVELIRAAGRRRSSRPAPDSTVETLVAAGLVGAGVNIAMRWVLGGYREPIDEVIDSLVLICEGVSTRITRRTRT